MNPGDWAWSEEHREVCRVVDGQDLWPSPTGRSLRRAKSALPSGCSARLWVRGTSPRRRLLPLVGVGLRA